MNTWLYAVGGLLLSSGLVVSVAWRATEPPRDVEPITAATSATLMLPSAQSRTEAERVWDTADLDPETASRLLTIEQRRGERVAVHEWRVADAAPLWFVRNMPAPGLPLEEGEAEDGRAFLDFNRLKLDAARPRDRLELRIPQLARSYTLTIEEVREHGGGIYSWGGQLDDLPPHYSAVITQGPRHTHGGIATPEGHYTIEVYGESGWIVSTDTIADYGGAVSPAPVPPALAEEEAEQTQRQ